MEKNQKASSSPGFLYQEMLKSLYFNLAVLTLFFKIRSQYKQLTVLNLASKKVGTYFAMITLLFLRLELIITLERNVYKMSLCAISIL